MEEYTEAGFSAHPKLSHILNLHLQDNALMKDSIFNDYVKRTDAKLKEQQAAIAKLLSEMEKLTSKVNARR